MSKEVWDSDRKVFTVNDLNEFIAAPENVTELDLSSEGLTDEDCFKLARVLLKAKSLSRLSLYNNQIGDKGAMAIAKGLVNLKSLRELHLNNNKISGKAAILIANEVSKLQSFSYLYLWVNHISPEDAKIIQTKLSNKIVYLANQKAPLLKEDDEKKKTLNMKQRKMK